METGWDNGKIFEFADFRLIPAEELLLRNGERVHLSPKSFRVLALLVERHGHLVTKSEIIEAIWEDAFVEEGALPKAVWSARNALGDASKERFIQTVPRRGYRFISPVTLVTGRSGAYRLPDLAGLDEADNEAPSDTEEQSSNSLSSDVPRVDGATDTSRKGFNRPAALAGVVLVLLGAVTLFYSTLGGRNLLGKGDRSRIAVMPLRPLDLQGGDAIYDLGIAEALILKLSGNKNLSIRQLDAVRLYAAGNDDPVKVGTEQDVDYVLYTHYQLAGGKIKVTAKLIEVASGNIEDNYSTTTQSADPFAAHEAIANDIGNRLLARFGAGSSDFRPKRETNNQEAYRHYQLAMNFNELRGPENGRNALEHIEQAVALDPNFARAWAAKAYIHRYLLSPGGDRHDQYRKSMDAVNRALAIDPELSEAYSALCFNKNRYEYDPAGAEKACKRALELEPDSPIAHKLYSNLLYSQGRFEEAIYEIERAMELQPVSYDNRQTYALALFYARRFDASEGEWKSLIHLNPDHGLIYDFLVQCLRFQGKEPEAFEYLIKRLSIDKADDEKMQRFRTAYDTSGWRGVSMERIRLEEAKPAPEPNRLSRFYADIGDRDKAFEYLEKSYEQRSNMIAVLQVDPGLDPLRGDPRYPDMVRRIFSSNTP